MDTMEQKTERNIRVQTRYDELMREGKRGHYETLFRVVREEVEAERERLRDELNLCCELKREYQQQAAAERERCAKLCEAMISRAPTSTSYADYLVVTALADAAELIRGQAESGQR